jgi:hypothetical protein
MSKTYEQLERKLHLAQEGLLKAVLDRIAELENKINRDSQNSSKPPSIDQKGNTPEDHRKNPRKP